MKTRCALVLLLVLSVFLALGSSPAYSQTVHRQDAKDDAPATIDVRGVDYSHAKRRVRVEARIPDLGNRGSAALSISKFTIFEAGYVLEIVKRAGKQPKLKFGFFNHFEVEPRECSTMSGRWSGDTVFLSVARKCLVGHVRERLFVQFGIQRGQSVDLAPPVRRLRRG
jgi:hypothetical protein